MTRLPLAAALAVALCASGSALAAQTTTAPANAATASSDDMKSLNQSNLKQQLQDQLSKAGYTSIKIMPSSFYVQAKDKKGDPVAMVIGPDSFTEVTEMKAQTSAAAQPQTPQPQSSPNATQK